MFDLKAHAIAQREAVLNEYKAKKAAADELLEIKKANAITVEENKVVVEKSTASPESKKDVKWVTISDEDESGIMVRSTR